MRSFLHYIGVTLVLALALAPCAGTSTRGEAGHRCGRHFLLFQADYVQESAPDGWLMAVRGCGNVDGWLGCEMRRVCRGNRMHQVARNFLPLGGIWSRRGGRGLLRLVGGGSSSCFSASLSSDHPRLQHRPEPVRAIAGSLQFSSS